MEKKGSVLVIIAIVLGSMAVVAIGAGVYFYNFHVFKEVRLCLGEPIDTGFECAMVQDCINKAEEMQVEYNMSDLPDFAREKIELLADEAVYCEETCKIREIRGINPATFELEELESCNPDEKEILIEVHGKEGIEVWNYIKEKEDQRGK